MGIIGKILKEGKKAVKLTENQKGKINTLQSKSRASQAESGMGTASKARIASGERGKALQGAKAEYKRTLNKLENNPNLSDEQMEIMLGKLKDLEKRYGKSVITLKDGGMAKKNKGAMDYRVGGMVMSTVDNRKKR